MERVREGIGCKFSMITQYVSTFFSGIIVGLLANWRLTLIILCIGPLLIAVSGALAMVKILGTLKILLLNLIVMAIIDFI